MEADNVVEEVAKAIWNSRGEGNRLYMSWNDKAALEEWKETYRVAARAALDAIEAEIFSQTVTTDSEVIFGGIRLDPGTYQVRRVDPPTDGTREARSYDPGAVVGKNPLVLTQGHLAKIALAIYRQVQKDAGLTKQDAHALWKALGPEGRGRWKLVAKQAIAAFSEAEER